MKEGAADGGRAESIITYCTDKTGRPLMSRITLSAVVIQFLHVEDYSEYYRGPFMPHEKSKKLSWAFYEKSLFKG